MTLKPFIIFSLPYLIVIEWLGRRLVGTCQPAKVNTPQHVLIKLLDYFNWFLDNFNWFYSDATTWNTSETFERPEALSKDIITTNTPLNKVTRTLNQIALMLF